MTDTIRTEGLTAEHRAFLEAQAVDVELALALGVRSLLSHADTAELPGHWPNWANYPAILFPWAGPDGRVEYQVRPDTPTPTASRGGRLRKYVFQRDMTPVLWHVTPRVVAKPGEPILVVEGTKQALAAASYAPAGVHVYGMAGARMWQKDGVPIPDLYVADGQEVVVILDADAATNREVYLAGAELAEALAMEGATKVRFTRLAGGMSKSGLDDILGRRAASRRGSFLARLIAAAKAKPADKLPAARKRDQNLPSGEDRVTIVCNRDRLEVINDLTTALLNRWNGRELFCHGGILSRFADGRMNPIERGSSRDLIQETAITVDENEGAQGTSYSFTWPDSNSIAAVMSRAGKFAPLDRIAHAPFVRPDGSIVTDPGYDEATRSILIPDPELDGLTVPESPSPDQVRAAVELLMTEWLGDFPFAADADRANVLALLVTPAIRGLVPKVPLAVIDGLQMGVGKNLLVDSLLTVYTGAPLNPMNWVDDAEELRKQITSAFRTGAEFFVFDEAHTVEGAPLAQALTAETWQDRILGFSTMANFPNRVTWLSLGNNVQVKGDVTRRVYRIALRPTYADPQDRPASSFRHPGQSGLDLGSWTRKNRRELLTAILTLVRAWFAADCPPPSRGVSFGSFEAWERITGGIVELAGLPGFLTNLKVWRSESDFDSQYWANHLAWLEEQFGLGQAFRTADVRTKALTALDLYMAPPRLDDPTERTYSKQLGEAYSRMRGRRYGRRWVERVGNVSGHVSSWIVNQETEEVPPVPQPAPEPDSEPVDPDSDVSTVQEDPHPEVEVQPEPEPFEPDYDPPPAYDTEVLTIDLETGSADDLYRTGPGYVRLAGWAENMAEVELAAGRAPDEFVVDRMATAEVITGHNIMAFDLPAMVRAGTLRMDWVHQAAAEGRLFDAILAARQLDPPMARDKGVDATRKYDLDSIASRLGLGHKLGDVSKALAKKHGGWDQIPIDDESEDGRAFRAYLTQDVELSRRLYGVLSTNLADLGPGPWDYVQREHRVAALASQFSLNGFRVDVDGLAAKVAEINANKAEAFAMLAARYGLPLADPKGKPYVNPLVTKLGRAAIEAAFVAAGVPAKSLWRTGTSEVLDLSGDHMVRLAQDYRHVPAVREIARAIYVVVGSRSVYETAQNNLIGDRVHPRISFAQATGRWSVTSPGLTVFGKHGGRHVERMIFLPDPGEVILTADLSQVDMRAVAGLSGDPAYIQMLRTEDPHSEIAKLLFGTAARRQDAKRIGHGWNYGRSIRAISEGDGIDPEIVVQFDTSMRERFARLVEWQGEVRAIAESGELLDNGFGRRMRPDPQRAWTQGPALMGQGAARDLMMEGLLRLPAEVHPMLRAQVHDEIVLSVPADQAEDVGRAVVDALSFEWNGVPITADTGPLGKTWGHCYEK